MYLRGTNFSIIYLKIFYCIFTETRNEQGLKDEYQEIIEDILENNFLCEKDKPGLLVSYV